MADNIRCSNMNHGRSNVSIRCCTDCGKVLNDSIRNPCNEALHAERRKNRNVFCHSCGKKLAGDPSLKR